MADISAIKLPDNTTYNIKDATARANSGVTGVKGNAESSYRTGNVNLTVANIGAVAKSGDTMTGKLTLNADQYSDAYNSGALDLKNSNIDGVNSIYTADISNNAQEGIHFYRDGTHVDSVHAKSGVLYFTPNRQLGSAGTPKRIYHEGSSVYEADLVWGGKNFTASYGPIDAAMISDLGANRLEIPKAAGITVEYSRDGGTTWIDYELTDAQKQGVFSSIGTGLYLGKYTSTDFGNVTTDWKLRVTLISPASGVYTVLNKFAIYVATQGAEGCYVTIDACTKGNESSFVTFANQVHVGGWSGWNIINTSGITTCGNASSTSQYSKIRFTFGITSTGSHSTDSAYPTSHGAMQVSKILGFGGVGWGTPSNLAKNGHIYTYDVAQNATFPAKVIAARVTTPIVETESSAQSYFQTRRLRGEGAAATYYHAIDFGYSGHNQIDFYEYGGIYNFHKHTGADVSAGDTLLGTINDKGWDGKVNNHTINADVPFDAEFTDTKNTAGSTDSSSKLFLIGATSQAANPQTYSHDTAYVGTNGHLYSASKEVLVGGSNASSSVTITPTTTDVYSMTSAGSVTAGTATTPAVINTSKFNGGSFTRGSFSGGSFTQGTDSFTANTPTAINTSKFSGGSFTRGSFSGGSLTFAIDGTDTNQLNITFTPATHGNDTFTAASLQSGFYTAGTAASFTQGTDSFTAATHGNDTFTAASLQSGFYTAGTKGTPTAVTLPGRSSVIKAWTGYSAATAAAQTFTGAKS